MKTSQSSGWATSACRWRWCSPRPACRGLRRGRGRVVSTRSTPAAATSRTSRRPRSRCSSTRDSSTPPPTTSEIAECDAVIICVPTPLTANREPDLSFVSERPSRSPPHLRRGPARRARVDDLPRARRARSWARCSRARLRSQGGPRLPPRDLARARRPRAAPTSRSRRTPKVVGGLTPACTARARRALQARARQRRPRHDARGRRADEAAREHLPLRQHRAA